MATGTFTETPNYVWQNVRHTAPTTTEVTYSGGRLQSIPVVDGSQNDPFTHYLGAGLNVASRVKVTNNTGWTINVAYSGGPPFTSLTPGGETSVTLPGDVDALDAIDTPIYQLDFVLESAEGTDGTIDTEVLGVP